MATGNPEKIRRGIATARERLADMMATVEHAKTTGRDQHGVIHANPVPVDAIVEDVAEIVIDDDGNEAMSASKLTILEPYEVKTTDLFIVKGEELHVAKMKALLDPQQVPYFVEVWLGRGKLGSS